MISEQKRDETKPTVACHCLWREPLVETVIYVIASYPSRFQRPLCDPGRVVLILEYQKNRSLLVEPCTRLRGATGLMPIAVWRRNTVPSALRLVATKLVVEPQRICRAYGDVSPPDSERINKTTDFFVLDPEVFGVRRTNDAVHQSEDRRFI